jgi:shikimate dehydrogenase
MKQFGLVGKKLSHSFSKSWFEKKFREAGLADHRYENYELEKINFIAPLLKNPQIKGLNVTMPYKESVISFLDDLSAEARKAHAVNCIQFKNGITIGHNTDIYGFSQSIKPFLDTNHERALILGTGGASRAVTIALQKIGVEIFYATTSGKKGDNYFFYEEISERMLSACKLVINTTPTGMFPNVSECPPLPYGSFTTQHLAYDLIYNPEQTLFLKKAAENGSVTLNGLSMLQLQAEKSWEIWNS